MKIAAVRGREVFNGIGEPTVECEIELTNGALVTASVPSGTSRGAGEARELRDGADRFLGLGVNKAIDRIDRVIQPLLVGREPNGASIDEMLIEADATKNFSSLGANTALAVSMAGWRAEAVLRGLPLWKLISLYCGTTEHIVPAVILNIFSGGQHARGHVQFQEYNIVQKIMEVDLSSWFEVGALYLHAIRTHLDRIKIPYTVSIEGGFAPNFPNDFDVVAFLAEVQTQLPVPMQEAIGFYLDAAASTFYQPEHNTYLWDNKHLSSRELIQVYKDIGEALPLIVVEDGMADIDEAGWKMLKKTLDSTLVSVSDDLCTSRAGCIRTYKSLMKGVVIKPIQVGTVLESINAIQTCKELDLLPVLSHRSRETEDTFIVDLCIGAQVPLLKSGGLLRGERTAKYNRLLRIYDALVRELREKSSAHDT